MSERVIKLADSTNIAASLSLIHEIQKVSTDVATINSQKDAA